MIRSTVFWARAAVPTGLVLVIAVFLYSVASPWNLIGRTDPIGGEAGYAGVASRAEAAMKETGARWIATTDYRTYAMLRWHLRDRVPVIQINERARFIGFHDPGFEAIKGQPGLYVAREPDDGNPIWASTTAVFDAVGRVDRVWRGEVMSSYVMKRLTGWTPELNPPQPSPLYQWRWLA
jgi:hypothetical protein